MHYVLVLRGILSCFCQLLFLIFRRTLWISEWIQGYPLLQLRRQIFGGMGRIYITISNCRVILPSSFIHFLLYVFSHIVNTFDPNCLPYCFRKITQNKLLRRFNVRFIFIKFCTQPLLFLNKLDTNIRLFKKLWWYFVLGYINSCNYQNLLPFRCFILIEMLIL